jgi:DNA-binding HxlR family transcriptional regulator
MQSLETPAYGVDDCPSQRAIGMIADKWKLLILIQLSRAHVLRFKELQRSLGTVSQKVLTGALRELEADALVERTAYAEVPPRVEYRPTPRARALLPILRQLEVWAAATAETVSEPAPLR